MTKERPATRRPRRKKSTTWVAGIVGVTTALAPYIIDLVRAFRKH